MATVTQEQYLVGQIHTIKKSNTKHGPRVEMILDVLTTTLDNIANKSVQVIAWGDQAEATKHFARHGLSFVTIKRTKVSKFNGRPITQVIPDKIMKSSHRELEIFRG